MMSIHISSQIYTCVVALTTVSGAIKESAIKDLNPELTSLILFFWLTKELPLTNTKSFRPFLLLHGIIHFQQQAATYIKQVVPGTRKASRPKHLVIFP